MRFLRKKSTAIFLTIFVIAISGAFSAYSAKIPVSKSTTKNQGIDTPKAELTGQGGGSTAQFLSFSGTVKKLSAFYESDGQTKRPGWYFISVEDSNGHKGTIAITDKTYIATDIKPSRGTPITCFYDANAPMPAIEPPRYNADVVVIGSQDAQAVKVDRFDGNMLSSDSMLKLNIADTTEIITQDGKAFKGDLKDRKLVVYYTFSTRSIPAQTTPDKIIVLFEAEQSIK